MELQIPTFFDKTPFRVTPDKDKVSVLNTQNQRISGLAKAELSTSDFSRAPDYAADESGNTAAAGIYRHCGNKFSVCFPVSLEPGECSVFKLGNGCPANDFPYNDTVKTSEGEYHHITACDNGTLIISDKPSGNIFFETPTFILSNAPANDGFKLKTEIYGTRSSVIKSSSAVHTVFTSIIPLSLPDNTENELKVISHVFHGKGDSTLLFFAEYGSLPENTLLTLRLPTGAAFPAFSADEADAESPETYGKYFDISEKLTLFGEDGVKFTVIFDEKVSASVSCGGNIDIILPSGSSGSFGYTINTN